jgi:hypothetical protein
LKVYSNPAEALKSAGDERLKIPFLLRRRMKKAAKKALPKTVRHMRPRRKNAAVGMLCYEASFFL